MGVRIIELKTDDKEKREFIFKISATEHILHYEELSFNVEEVKEYVKNNPPPKDKFFDIDEFISDLDSECYISIVAEKYETAEYIADLIYEIF